MRAWPPQVFALLMLPCLASAASFTPLGGLQDAPYVDSNAFDVSAAGNVVVGSSINVDGYRRAFRWTSAGGMEDLGLLTGGAFFGSSSVTGASADGTRLVGTSWSPNATTQAFQWTIAGGMVALPAVKPGRYDGGAADISADGLTIVGGAIGESEQFEAAMWNNGIGVGLGFLPGGQAFSSAVDVSADGTVVVGESPSSAADGDREAFRWTEADGMVGLGDLPGGLFRSGARGVSADGSVVVGVGRTQFRDQAFRWTSATGMVGLQQLSSANDSVANAVSADGSVVVGTEGGGSNSTAFLWTEAGGMQRVLDVLVANGATGLTGWTLNEVNAISADGQWIVGKATNSLNERQAFLANISPIPIPAAVWLFGSAMGAIGITRRKTVG